MCLAKLHIEQPGWHWKKYPNHNLENKPQYLYIFLQLEQIAL